MIRHIWWSDLLLAVLALLFEREYQLFRLTRLELGSTGCVLVGLFTSTRQCPRILSRFFLS